MLPLKHTVPARSFAVVNWLLMAANVVLFLSMFLHGGWLHLLGNMLALYIFGDNVEDRLGHGGYAIFYLLCGLTAGLRHILFNPTSPVPSIGASGAISGVLGAYFLLFPSARVITLIPPSILPGIVEIPALVYIGFWLLSQLLNGTLEIVAGAQAYGGVAWWAHAGGFIAGLVLAAEQIAHALRKHPAKVTVLVPHYAMSGGTLIALAADEIVLDDNAVLGPLDPQLGQQAAASILKVVERKDINEVDDATIILADTAEKAIRQVKATVNGLLCERMGAERAEQVATTLATGTWTHDYPISVDEARELGLPVSTDMPKEVYKLMGLYPQTAQRRPSVEYIPAPRSRELDRRPARASKSHPDMN